MWTAFRGDPRNLYYRNRARRLTSDGSSILFKEDVSPTVEVETANYVEYHALAYLGDIPPSTAADPITREIVRVEVVFLNYDDGVNDANDNDDSTARIPMNVNVNVLEKGGEDNIALGLEFDPGARTETGGDGASPVTGSVSYRGRYLGQNRLTFDPQTAYDVDGSDGVAEIPMNTEIEMRENNIPIMTMNVNFGATGDQLPVRFRIINTRLRVNDNLDPTGVNVRVEGIMDMNIEGEAALELPGDGGVISLSRRFNYIFGCRKSSSNLY